MARVMAKDLSRFAPPKDVHPRGKVRSKILLGNDHGEILMRIETFRASDHDGSGDPPQMIHFDVDSARNLRDRIDDFLAKVNK